MIFLRDGSRITSRLIEVSSDACVEGQLYRLQHCPPKIRRAQIGSGQIGVSEVGVVKNSLAKLCPPPKSA
jgi:hypothetical protein